eukprot:1151184-Pelagomonas_calceolata.AAC.2
MSPNMRDGETCDPQQADSSPKDQQSVPFVENDWHDVSTSWQTIDGMCSQGILGSSANHNDTGYTHTEPDHLYTAAVSQNGTPSIPLTHPNTPNSPNTHTGSQNPRKKRKKLLQLEIELQTSTIDPLASSCDGGSIWKYKETSVKNLAQETTANHAIKAIYNFEFDITLIDAWRTCPAKRRDTRNDPLSQQMQYNTHYGPMMIEK